MTFKIKDAAEAPIGTEYFISRLRAFRVSMANKNQKWIYN